MKLLKAKTVVIRREKRGATAYATSVCPPEFGTREENGGIVRAAIESGKRFVDRWTTNRANATLFPREIGEQVLATAAATESPHVGELRLLPAD